MFVHDLAAAYVKYAQFLDLKREILHTSDGHVVLKFKGNDVWKAFQHEGGKHCVQRVPPTENKGRRHTSTISVMVLPLPPARDLKPLAGADLKVKTQGGHGKGGQHQNVTDSAVRMKHTPTGLHVFINGRDQHVNRREALRILTARVNEYYQRLEQQEYSQDRKKQHGGGNRSDKKRTYNFINSRVVDHALGTKTKQIKQVMKGRFDLLGINK